MTIGEAVRHAFYAKKGTYEVPFNELTQVEQECWEEAARAAVGYIDEKEKPPINLMCGTSNEITP
jgi:hypothetical protein